MRKHDIFPSKYFSGSAMRGSEPLHLIIESVVAVDFKDPQTGATKRRPVVQFVGGGSGLTLGIENFNAIALAYGDDTDLWIGRSLIVRHEYVKFGSRTVDGVRGYPPDTRPPSMTPTPGGSRHPPQPSPPSRNNAVSSEAPMREEAPLPETIDDDMPF